MCQRADQTTRPAAHDWGYKIAGNGHRGNVPFSHPPALTCRPSRRSCCSLARGVPASHSVTACCGCPTASSVSRLARRFWNGLAQVATPARSTARSNWVRRRQLLQPSAVCELGNVALRDEPSVCAAAPARIRDSARGLFLRPKRQRPRMSTRHRRLPGTLWTQGLLSCGPRLSSTNHRCARYATYRVRNWLQRVR